MHAGNNIRGYGALSAHRMAEAAQLLNDRELAVIVAHGGDHAQFEHTASWRFANAPPITILVRAAPGRK